MVFIAAQTDIYHWRVGTLPGFSTGSKAAVITAFLADSTPSGIRKLIGSKTWSAPAKALLLDFASCFDMIYNRNDIAETNIK